MASQKSRLRWAVTLVLPVLHLCLCLAIALDIYASEGSWAGFLLYLIDYPFSILLLPAANVAGYLLVFGVGGTMWWYVISRICVYLVLRIDAAVRGAHPGRGQS